MNFIILWFFIFVFYVFAHWVENDKTNKITIETLGTVWFIMGILGLAVYGLVVLCCNL